MLGGNDRDRLPGCIVAFHKTPLIDIGEVRFDRFFLNGCHGKPDMLAPFLFHFSKNGIRHDIPGQQLIDEALSLSDQKHCTLTPDRLRDQKLPAFFFRIERGGVDLNIVDVPEPYTVFQGKGNGIAC